MKKIKASILIILCSILLCGCSFGINRQKEPTIRDVKVLRINSDENIYNEDCYAYKSGTTLHKVDLPEEKDEAHGFDDRAVIDIGIDGEWIYYYCDSIPVCEVGRYNYLTKADEIILTSEDMLELNEKLYNPNTHPTIDVYKGKLWLYMFNQSAEIYVISNKEDGTWQIDQLLNEAEVTDNGKIAIYDGVQVEWEPNGSPDRYIGKSVREIDSGLELLYEDLELHVNVDGIDYEFKRNAGEKRFYYIENGSNIEHDILCLPAGYAKSDFFREKMTVEDGKIIGIMPIVTDTRFAKYPEQWTIKKDILFSIDPKMNTSEIIFETKNNDTRIIGYKEGEVYLFEGYSVYSYNLENEISTELFSVESGYDYIFDWQAGYLVVFRDETRDQFVKAYKVE